MFVMIVPPGTRLGNKRTATNCIFCKGMFAYIYMPNNYMYTHMYMPVHVALDMRP